VCLKHSKKKKKKKSKQEEKSSKKKVAKSAIENENEGKSQTNCQQQHSSQLSLKPEPSGVLLYFRPYILSLVASSILMKPENRHESYNAKVNVKTTPTYTLTLHSPSLQRTPL